MEGPSPPAVRPEEAPRTSTLGVATLVYQRGGTA